MPTGQPFGQRFVHPMIYASWIKVHEEELEIAAAESGADREHDFNPDEWYESHYEEYVRNYHK